MPRTFYTIDDLFQFCKTNNFAKFSSKEYENKPLIIQSIETFSAKDGSKDGLLPVELMACHIGKNRNGSAISEDNMKKYMNSFKGRPILGAIYKTDTDEYEFRSHDIKITDDGKECTIEYIEQPVGVISELTDPYLKYDSEEDKTYLMASGNIFEDYSHAAEILQRRKTCKCSVEIAVNEMSWNADEDYLSIDDFSFRGVTILGYEQDGVTEIEEGMKGSKITIDSFSAEQNSMFSSNYREKLLETLDKLNATLSKFSIENTDQKGVENEDMNHFEELLEAYELTVEDIDFEVEGLSDEELDAIFEEHFGCKKKKKYEDGEEGFEDETGNEEEDEEEAESDPDVPEEEDEPVEYGKNKYSIDENGNVTLTCELSHDDIRSGIYSLLYAEGNEYNWIVEVFDNKFIYQDYNENKFYRRDYSVDGDNVALGDKKVEVFNEWLSQDEKDAIASLKSDYAKLKEFKDNYDAAELKASKDAVLDRDEFAELKDTEGFKELVDNIDKFSVEEVETKAKALFADYVISQGNFTLKKRESNKPMGKVGFNFSKPSKKKAYGNLFD